MKNDEYFGEMEVYLDSFLAELAIARATPDAMELELEFGYQGCAEGGLCYMPQTRVLTVSLPEATAVSALESATPAGAGAPMSEQAFLADVLVNQSIWKAIGLFFLAGLALALTPCVLPMIPILSGIIAGQGKRATPGRSFMLSLTYVLGMALTYTVAGAAFAAAGQQAQTFFQQPWILVVFALLFVALALSMFGLYELSQGIGLIPMFMGLFAASFDVVALVTGIVSAVLSTLFGLNDWNQVVDQLEEIGTMDPEVVDQVSRFMYIRIPVQVIMVGKH